LTSFLIPKRLRPRFYGAYCFVACDNQVLLVRNWAGTGRWSLPGGGIEHGEQPEQAMRRELQEELKLTVGAVTELGFFENRHPLGRPGRYLFATSTSNQNFVRNRFELRAAEWFPLDNLPDHRHEMVEEAIIAMNKARAS
jgi:8-oxo-dGTP diphosphatase